MSSRLFGTTSDYARFTGTPPVTAAPLTFLLAGQVSSIVATNTGFIICNSANANSQWRLNISPATGTLNWVGAGGGSGGATSANAITVDTPFIAVCRELANNSRNSVLNGDLANQGNNFTTATPASLNRLSFGKRDDSGNTNPWAGPIFYAALYNAVLTDDEVLALGLLANAAPPPLIRPSALMCYWPNFGRSDGTTIIDVMGRCPLVIAGGSNSDIAIRRVVTQSNAGFVPGIAAAETVTELDAGTVSAAGSDLVAAVVAPLDAGTASAAGSDLVVDNKATLDSGTVSAAGADLALDNRATLDTGTATGAGSDLAAAARPTLDTGSATAAGSDLAAATRVTLDTGTVSAAGSDLATSQDRVVQLDTGTATATGADLATSQDRIVQLDTGAATAVGADLTTLQDVTITLDTGTVSAAGADLAVVLAGTALLDAGFVTAAGAGLDVSVIAVLDVGTASAAGNDLLAAMRSTLDAGTVSAQGADLLVNVRTVLDTGTVSAAGSDLLLEQAITFAVGAVQPKAMYVGATPVLRIAMGSQVVWSAN